MGITVNASLGTSTSNTSYIQCQPAKSNYVMSSQQSELSNAILSAIISLAVVLYSWWVLVHFELKIHLFKGSRQSQVDTSFHDDFIVIMMTGQIRGIFKGKKKIIITHSWGYQIAYSEQMWTLSIIVSSWSKMHSMGKKVTQEINDCVFWVFRCFDVSLCWSDIMWWHKADWSV